MSSTSKSWLPFASILLIAVEVAPPPVVAEEVEAGIPVEVGARQALGLLRRQRAVRCRPHRTGTTLDAVVVVAWEADPSCNPWETGLTWTGAEVWQRVGCTEPH